MQQDHQKSAGVGGQRLHDQAVRLPHDGLRYIRIPARLCMGWSGQRGHAGKAQKEEANSEADHAWVQISGQKIAFMRTRTAL